jgi:copper chaperone CopZ
MDIKKAVAEVPGVKSQEIAIEGYLMAVDLEKIINEEI